jgi:hypothetical protein
MKISDAMACFGAAVESVHMEGAALRLRFKDGSDAVIHIAEAAEPELVIYCSETPEAGVPLQWHSRLGCQLICQEEEEIPA